MPVCSRYQGRCRYLISLGPYLFGHALALFYQAPSAEIFAQSSSASVKSVQNAGLLFTNNPAGVSGTDAGYSIPLEKKTLWLFGDVFLQDLNKTNPHSGAVSNCGLVVPRVAAGTAALQRYRFLTDPKTGLARQLLTSTRVEGKDLRFWPFGGWYDPASKRVNLFYGRIRTTGNGAFAFRTEGFGLSQADPDVLTFQPIPAAKEEELWWPNESGKPTFGNAVVYGAKGNYLYVVGQQERSGRRYGKLARVLKTHVTELSAYEYYAGGSAEPKWSREPADSADVDGLTDFPTELSIVYNAYLGGYLAFHSVDISERGRLVLAANPWGPYKQIGEIPTPKRAMSNGFCYAGKEHPELAVSGGRVIYVTYVDSSIYWLHLLKVTLRR